MSAYGIYIRERTRDPEEMKTYAEMAQPLLNDADVTVLAAYGVQDVLEGPAPEGVVIVRFPSLESQSRLLRQPGYRAAVRRRFLGADYRSLLVEGLDDME
jgi:uncharacterized protein (DUF1330 family)